MNGFISSVAAALVCLLLFAVLSLAQERGESDKTKPVQASPAKAAQVNPQANAPKSAQQPTARPAQARADAWQIQGDSQLATWLFAECEAKIEIAKFVMDKTSNEDVKELAQQEVFDHSEFMEQLRRFGPLPLTTSNELNADPYARSRNAEQPGRPAAEQGQNRTPQQSINNPLSAPPRVGEALTPAARASAAPTMTGRVDLARVKQEIARQCVATFKKELNEKNRGEFDKCYVGHQVAGHLLMADTLKVMKKFASADMRTVIEQGEKTANEHLDHAKTLMESLDRAQPNERTALKQDL